MLKGGVASIEEAHEPLDWAESRQLNGGASPIRVVRGLLGRMLVRVKEKNFGSEIPCLSVLIPLDRAMVESFGSMV